MIMRTAYFGGRKYILIGIYNDYKSLSKRIKYEKRRGKKFLIKKQKNKYWGEQINLYIRK